MHTTTFPGHHLNVAGFTVTAHIKGLATLDATDSAYVALANVVLASNAASEFFLGDVAAWKIVIASTLSLKPFYAGLLHLFRKLNDMLAEILNKYACISKIHIHTARTTQMPDHSRHKKAIQAREHGRYVRGKS